MNMEIMKNASKNHNEECFEGNDFVRECLESFDENVLEIDACLMQIQRMQ